MVGFAGWFNIVISMELYIVLALISVAALADSVHVMSGYLLHIADGKSHELALSKVMEKTAPACLMTSLTTSTGLFSLVFVPFETIQNMGILGGLGVLYAFFVTLFIMPLMLDLWSPKISKTRASNGTGQFQMIQKVLNHFEPLGRRYPKLILLIFSGMSILLFFGLTRVTVDTNLSRAFKENTPVRKVLNLLNTSFNGTSDLDILIETSVPEGIKDPDLLRTIDRLEILIAANYPQWYRSGLSIATLVKQTHQKLNGDREEMYLIPQDKALLAQILFLIETGTSEDFGQLVSGDFSSARLSLRLKDPGSYISVQMVQEIQLLIDEVFKDLHSKYSGLETVATGGLAVWSRINDRISWSQIQSFGLAFAVISFLLFFIFGSLRMGFISIVPNVFPALTVFGTMGLLKIPLDLTTLLVAPVIIGIAVDDTIHFLTHYRIARASGYDIETSIKESFREAGQAIFITSLILIVSFAVFIPVSHVGIARFSALAILAITSALLSDLLILPALCQRFDQSPLSWKRD